MRRVATEIRSTYHSQATISGLWNAAYAVGWAAGPAIGGALYAAMLRRRLCLSEDGGGCVEVSHSCASRLD